MRFDKIHSLSLTQNLLTFDCSWCSQWKWTIYSPYSQNDSLHSETHRYTRRDVRNFYSVYFKHLTV